MKPEERAVCERLLAASSNMSMTVTALAEMHRSRAAMRALLDRPVAQPMTDGEIDAVWDVWFGQHGFQSTTTDTRRGFARAVEAHHDIGVTK